MRVLEVAVMKESSSEGFHPVASNAVVVQGVAQQGPKGLETQLITFNYMVNFLL